MSELGDCCQIVDNPVRANWTSRMGGDRMVIGVLLSSIVGSLAGLAVSLGFAGNLPIVLASYVVWGMTGALGFIYACVPAVDRRA